MTGEEAYWAGLGPEDCEPEWTRADEEAMLAQADYYDQVQQERDMEPPKEQFVVRLRTGQYWIAPAATTGNADAAKKFDTRFQALREIGQYPASIMAMAVIELYQRPSERPKPAPEASS